MQKQKRIRSVVSSWIAFVLFFFFCPVLSSARRVHKTTRVAIMHHGSPANNPPPPKKPKKVEVHEWRKKNTAQCPSYGENNMTKAAVLRDPPTKPRTLGRWSCSLPSPFPSPLTLPL